MKKVRHNNAKQSHQAFFWWVMLLQIRVLDFDHVLLIFAQGNMDFIQGKTIA